MGSVPVVVGIPRAVSVLVCDPCGIAKAVVDPQCAFRNSEGYTGEVNRRLGVGQPDDVDDGDADRIGAIASTNLTYGHSIGRPVSSGLVGRRT